jgi:indole-3-glycerol phosphate synthase
MNVLAEIFERRRAAVDTLKSQRPLAEVRAMAADQPPTCEFARALRGAGLPAVIAEIKFRSPSEGVLRAEGTVAAIAREYAEHGAAALSVLTESDYFGGSLAALGAARAAVSLPALRKDFLFDPYQIYESRAAGADAVLLIAAMLERAQLINLTGLARELGLDVLLEVHSVAELESCGGIEGVIWGVNHRDLHTLKIDLDLSAQIGALLPPGTTRVAESGIASHADLLTMRERGYDAVLVGSSLMKAGSPGVALRQLITGV